MPLPKILSLTFQSILFHALDEQAKQFAATQESIYSLILSHFLHAK